MKIKVPWLAGLLSLLFTLAACSTGTAPGEDEEASGALRIGFEHDVTTLNPWMTKSVSTDMSVISQVYETLTVRDSDMEIQPLLAESWGHPASDTWLFHLRDDVTYANGEPFDAAVVKWNIEKVQEPDTQARIAPNMGIVESVEVVDDHTVQIKTNGPDTTMPALMSYFYFVHPDWADAHNLADEPMGTGPYELSQWNQNSLVELQRRDDYWGEAPSFETVEYQILPDPSAQIAAFQTGSIDVITAFAPDQMSTIENVSGVTSGSIPTIRSAFLILNTTHNEALEDKRVRQALNYAVDKEGIVEALFHGLVEPSNGQPMTEYYAGHNPDLEAYPYDPDRARELLADSGHDNLTLTLSYPTGSYLLADKVSQVIKEQMAEVGVTLDVQAEPFAKWLENMYAGELADAAYLTYAWPTLDGVDLLRNFAPGGAQSYWDDKEFGQTLTGADNASELDAHEAGIRDALEIMREEAPFVFLYPQPLTYAYSDTVEWTPRPDDWVRAYDMTQKK